MESTTSQTGTTLFAILEHPANNLAWSNFVDRYGPKVFRWCRSRGLQTADAEDVTQQVLSNFAKVARRFRYDRTKTGFRAWLRTVTNHALADLFEDIRKTRVCGSSRAQGVLETLKEPWDLDQELEVEFRRELLEKAMNAVCMRVESKTWQAFELLTDGEKSGKEVAELLHMSIAAAYVAKSRVQRMLAAEVGQLEPKP